MEKSTKKIDLVPSGKLCNNHQHHPPAMVVYEPGVYEHKCPGCGKVQTFVIDSKPILGL